MKRLYIILIALLLLASCSDKEEEGRISRITFKGTAFVNINGKSTLWTPPGTSVRPDSIKQCGEFSIKLKKPEAFMVSHGFNFMCIYLEPGDELTVIPGKHAGVGLEGDRDAVERNRLIMELMKIRKSFTGKRLKAPIPAAELDSLRALCHPLIGDFIRNSKACTPAFGRYLRTDQKYFELKQRIPMPNYLVKTYHTFTADDIRLLEECRKDSRMEEAVFSLYYRQVAGAYLDYLRIADPEGRMKDGWDYIRNEYRLGEYFNGKEVASMLRARALDAIGRGLEGDSVFLATAGLLPAEWGKPLLDRYSSPVHKAGGLCGSCPEIKGTDSSGREVALKDFRGKWVFIDFWGIRCGHCHFEIPYLKKLEEAIGNEDIVFLGICTDKDRGAWKKLLEEKSLSGIQLLCDREEVYRNFAVSSLPHFSLIGPDGRLVNNHMPRPSSGVPHHLLEACCRQK